MALFDKRYFKAVTLVPLLMFEFIVPLDDNYAASYLRSHQVS